MASGLASNYFYDFFFILIFQNTFKKKIKATKKNPPETPEGFATEMNRVRLKPRGLCYRNGQGEAKAQLEMLWT